MLTELQSLCRHKTMFVTSAYIGISACVVCLTGTLTVCLQKPYTVHISSKNKMASFSNSMVPTWGVHQVINWRNSAMKVSSRISKFLSGKLTHLLDSSCAIHVCPRCKASLTALLLTFHLPSNQRQSSHSNSKL